MDEQTTKDAARASAAARAKKLALRSCPRCGRLAKPPYYYHYACKNLDDAEFKTRIEAIPSRPMSLEIWCRMWGMTLDEGRESYANWKQTHA